jgi:hypothetical protein
MNRWRVGEDMGHKEMDGCPLTAAACFCRSFSITGSGID